MTEHKNLILFGAPGVGKGTQSKRLSKELNIPHIDTGSLIRKAIENHTELGVKAKEYVEAGKLVPDTLIIELIKEKLLFMSNQQIYGFILDGFPRTIAQADALQLVLSELHLKITRVINIKVPKDETVKRLSSRRLCSKKTCGAIYNLVSKPPKEEGKCDICNSDLFQRKDDSEEACAERFHEYELKTAPLEKYYKDLNLISDIDGTQDPDNVYNSILKLI